MNRLMNDHLFTNRLLGIVFLASGAIGFGITWVLAGGSAGIAGLAGIICAGSIAATVGSAIAIARNVILRRANARAAAHAVAHEPGASGGANLGVERQALREARHEAVQQHNAQDPVELWLQQQIAQAESYVQNARQQRALQQQVRTQTQQRSLHRSKSLDLSPRRTPQTARVRSGRSLSL
jgi:hypothetical protein